MQTLEIVREAATVPVPRYPPIAVRLVNAAAQADVAATISLVECEMTKRLSGLSEGDASSAASSSSTPPPTLPMPPP